MQDSVCEIHVNKVKPGMTAEYEKGRTQHMAWHKSQNDAWSWATWEITTGEGTGNYLIGTCGHSWKDFDAREKFNVEDSANATQTMGSSQSGGTMAYYVMRPDLGKPAPEGPPPAYLSVITFHVKPEGIMDFTNSVKQVMAAFEKTNAPRAPSTWYQLANGGRGPEFVLVMERKSMADMQSPSPKSLDEIVKEAYGGQADTIMSTLRKSYWGTTTELLHYRADLSYMAAKTK
jgi:hypothetical protein